MFGPYLAIESPPSWFFSLPPDPLPPSLPPPSDESTFKSPFPINAKLYNAVLDWKMPAIFAITYICSVTVMNQINRRRGYKAYSISKTGVFKFLVLLHNAFLAVYSGITCIAMLRALNVSLSGSMDKYGVPGAIDALCKIQGPRGYGDAVTYSPINGTWSSRNSLIHLGADNLTPDYTDVGRIWNEGLAFWGWFFYLSKFYEVIDTMIILAKGKRSSTLQTYHHAGAMLCMWAGMRYMSPPIWMFALVNSGIHTLMYTYYCVVGLGYRVNNAVKRTLTTMQIGQFLVGSAFALAHLFVSYNIPVAVPYTFTALATDLPSVASAASASVVSLASNIDPTSTLSSLVAEATQDGGAWLKKLIYRAGGSPALAENVRNHNRQTFGDSLRDPIVHSDLKREISEIRYHNEWHEVHCLDTNGQAFAIWLNVVYLLPLTILFLRFFWKTYVSGSRYNTKGKDGKPQKPRQLSENIQKAAKQTYDYVEDLGMKMEGEVDGVSEKVEHGAKEVKKEIKDANFEQKARRLREEMEEFTKGVLGNKDAGEKIQEQEEKVEEKVGGGKTAKSGGEKETAPAQPKSSETSSTKPTEVQIKAKDTASTASKTNGHDENSKPVVELKVEGAEDKDVEVDINVSTSSLKSDASGNASTPGTPSGKKHKSPKKKHT